MQHRSFKLALTALLTTGITLITTACASGGYKLTRQYASFVNRQGVIIRVVLYLLTAIVFAVTVLVDMVLFNTMDFWEGRVSAGDYKFEQQGKTFHVRHEVQPLNSLKRSTIKVMDSEQRILQTVVLEETLDGEIEMSVDGKLRTRVSNLSALPVASFFDVHGIKTDEKTVLFDSSTVQVAHR